jgi:hypothetical protein
MRDKANIYVDVNNAKYRGAAHAVEFFRNVTTDVKISKDVNNVSKKELLETLIRLSGERAKIVTRFNELRTSTTLPVYSTKFDMLSFGYLYRIYSREQLINGLSACIFLIGEYNKYQHPQAGDTGWVKGWDRI